MPNYQTGKIYKIISPHTEKCYVGSTTLKYLSTRMAQHREDLKKGKNITSKYILELGNYKIVLIELYPCNSKDELIARERHYIENLDCLNKHIPGRTKKEYYQDNKDIYCQKGKEYRLENKDIINQQLKEYRLKNKDKIKEYRLKNKDKIKEKVKEYQLKNKDKISENRAERSKIKITCECGKEVPKCSIARHKKSQRHIDIINNQSSL